MKTRKILHVGNIMNNGYVNCKYLRRRGIEADLLNVDYRHVQGQPEWEDVYIKEPVPDFNPEWSKVDLGGYKRPEWFYDISLQEMLALPDYLDRLSETPIEWTARHFMAMASQLPVLSRYIQAHKKLTPLESATEAAFSAEYIESHYKSLMNEYVEMYPQRHPPLSVGDVSDLLARSLTHAEVFRRYQLIQAYALDPIYVILGSPGQPFICFEHGTLRDFPYEDSARGRLYALSLKKAERIIITNADCNLSAERLGLKHYTFIPHPIDEHIYSPGESPLRHKLLDEHKCDFIFLAPSRHHWKHCPPGLENSWFKRNDIMIRGLGNIFRKHPDINAVVIFFEWGQEVALSKQLIEECGFSEKVRWEPIRCKRVMKDFYNACDIVLDQFNNGIGTFGNVVPESLACAKPVILNYKKELHHWCYPELPPALNAADEAEIEKCVVDLIRNRAYREDLGNTGRSWFMKYHSSKVVTDRMIDIYSSISEKFGWGWNF